MVAACAALIKEAFAGTMFSWSFREAGGRLLEQLRVMEGGAAEWSVYDLDSMLDEMLRESFPGVSRPCIRWGNRISKRRRRSIRLGSYYRPTTTIRIHPLLNSPEVPRYFVQSILFHELLHHVLGAAHDRRFHRHERTFRYHREARDWLRANLSMLLGFRERARRVPRSAPPVPLIPEVPPPALQRQLALF